MDPIQGLKQGLYHYHCIETSVSTLNMALLSIILTVAHIVLDHPLQRHERTPAHFPGRASPVEVVAYVDEQVRLSLWRKSPKLAGRKRV